MAHSVMLQPWYADDGAMNDEAQQVSHCFRELCRVGPPVGYYPNMEKL